jgi:hypothetical protein
VSRVLDSIRARPLVGIPGAFVEDIRAFAEGLEECLPPDGESWGYVLSQSEAERLFAVAEAAEDPFLALLESHPNVDGHVNAEMKRAADRLRAALAALDEGEQ